MKRKFAFLLMGPHFTPEQHQVCFETDNQISYIITVRSFEEAYEKLSFLQDEGVGVIELCGAFGEERAQEMIEMTNGKIAIGYVTKVPGQEQLFADFFAK